MLSTFQLHETSNNLYDIDTLKNNVWQSRKKHLTLQKWGPKEYAKSVQNFTFVLMLFY
jgi:hypothetical protein